MMGEEDPSVEPVDLDSNGLPDVDDLDSMMGEEDPSVEPVDLSTQNQSIPDNNSLDDLFGDDLAENQAEDENPKNDSGEENEKDDIFDGITSKGDLSDHAIDALLNSGDIDDKDPMSDWGSDLSDLDDEKNSVDDDDVDDEQKLSVAISGFSGDEDNGEDSYAKSSSDTEDDGITSLLDKLTPLNEEEHFQSEYKSKAILEAIDRNEVNGNSENSDKNSDENGVSQSKEGIVKSDIRDEQTMEKGGDKIEKEQTIQSPVVKSSNMMSIIFVAILGLIFGAAGSFGVEFLKDNDYIGPMGNTISQSEITNVVSKLESRFDKLSDRMKNSSDEKNKLIASYQSLSQSQDELMSEQANQIKMISKLQDSTTGLKRTSEKYETEMLGRLQSVLKLITGVAEKQNIQSQTIRETVLRDALLVMEKNTPEQSSDVKDIAVELRKSITRISQLEAAVIAQKSHLSLLEGETDYVKTSIQRIQVEGAKEKPKLDNMVKTSKVETSAGNNGSKNALKDFVFVSNEPETVKKYIEEVDSEKYYLIGVYAKGSGAYDLYLQPRDAKQATAFESFWYNPSIPSSIPGYGRIIGVRSVQDSRVPFVVVTENGIIRGKRL
jgi:hypothetical protein